MKIVIVGGVAGGASCATRARRLNENAEIVIFERGDNVSYANCGLPYFVGGAIAKEESLTVASPGFLRARFAIDVRVRSEVVGIDPAAKKVRVREREGREYEESYDKLVLAPGASAKTFGWGGEGDGVSGGGGGSRGGRRGRRSPTSRWARGRGRPPRRRARG